MKDYIKINGQKIPLTEDQIERIKNSFGISTVMLSDVPVGEVVKIADKEMVVLKQEDGKTHLILKGMYGEDVTFGGNNNYKDSNPDKKCQEFARELAGAIGWDNIVLHTVDLTSDDGLKDYCTIDRRASLITADMYRKFVEILDTCKTNQWWWLSTPHSTKRHDNENWVKCVSPSGYIYDGNYGNDVGVRPFCILKSNIFVSK